MPTHTENTKVANHQKNKRHHNCKKTMTENYFDNPRIIESYAKKWRQENGTGEKRWEREGIATTHMG